MMFPPALTRTPLVPTSRLVILYEPLTVHPPPQVSGAAGAARRSGLSLRIAVTLTLASELPVVAGLHAPACSVHPVATILTASLSPDAMKATVNPGATVVPKAATAKAGGAAVPGQLHDSAPFTILQPG